MNRKQPADVLGLVVLLIVPVLGFASDKSKNDAPYLSKITLEVNGNRLLLNGDSPIEVVKGDLIVIIDAWHEGATSPKSETVDLIGYAPKTTKKSQDDRSFVIHTGRDLQEKYALNADRTEYELRGLVGKDTVGRAVIRLVPPRLERVEINLNDKPKTLNDGETLELRATDRIAVTSVVTNIRGNESVTHEIKETKVGKGRSSKELIFARQGQVFGRIPIQWQE